MDAVFWTALGLLLAVLGVEAWLIRRERRERDRSQKPMVPPAKVGPTVQLVREPPPLEERKVIGRVAR